MAAQIEYLPLVHAVERATGRRPHLSTALRWCQNGRFGIRLNSRVLGGRRLCTFDDVLLFMELVTAASVGGIAPSVETPSSQAKRADRAADALRARLTENAIQVRKHDDRNKKNATQEIAITIAEPAPSKSRPPAIDAAEKELVKSELNKKMPRGFGGH